jgi:hypothetical protein
MGFVSGSAWQCIAKGRDANKHTRQRRPKTIEARGFLRKNQIILSFEFQILNFFVYLHSLSGIITKNFYEQ